MNIVLYTKDNCQNCNSAKNLLEARSIEYTAYDLSDPHKMAEFLQVNPEKRQMPQIWINGQYVGGLAGLQAGLKQLGL